MNTWKKGQQQKPGNEKMPLLNYPLSPVMASAVVTVLAEERATAPLVRSFAWVRAKVMYRTVLY